MDSRIKNVEIYELGETGKETSSPWSSTILLVKLTSADGLIGWGEAPTTLMTLPVRESMKEVERIFKGADFFNVEANVFDFYRNSFYLSKSMEATSALSAFEMASWDLIGKSAGTPVYKLFGGEFNHKIRAYSNGWYSDCRTPDEFVKKGKDMVKKGFTALKFDPFGPHYDRIDKDGIKTGAEIVGALRSELGDKVDLLIECHGRFDTRYAIQAAREIEPYEPMFFEEPVHPELEIGLAEFKRYIETPVALGERLLNKRDFTRLISQGLVDIIQPDLTNCMGLLEGKKIAAIADAFGVLVAYHNAFGPVQTAASVNMDYTLTNFLIQESFEESWPEWKRKLLKTGYKLSNGEFTLNGKPGLGFEIDEKLLEKKKVEGMEPFDPAEPPWVVSGTFKSKQKHG